MTSLIHLCLVLFIAAVGQGYATLDDVPEDTEYAYSDSPSIQLAGKPRFRRDAAPPQGKKTDSLFSRIMARAMQIKHNHNNKRTYRRSPKYTRTVYRRPYRTYPRTSSRTYRRTSSRTYRRTSSTPSTYRRTSSSSSTYRRQYRRPDYRTRYVRRTRSRSRPEVITPVRRVPTKSTSKSKPSLFHRIMNRVHKIREDHGNKHKHVPTRKIHPPSTRWSTKRKTIEEKPTEKVTTKKTSIFHSILKKVNEIKNHHHNKHVSRWNTKPKEVEKKPTRSWSSKPKVVEKKPTGSWTSKHKLVEEKPTRSWSSKSKPVEEKPTGSWSSKPTPEEKSPVKVIQPIERVSLASAPKGKPSLFHSIIQRVNQIKNNHHHKGVVVKIPSKSATSVVAGAAGGLLAAGLLAKMKDVSSAEDKKTIKIASWKVFEGKASRTVLTNGRAEICNKINLMKPTIFGLQDAINDQINAIRRCLPTSQYTYHRGRGRYDWKLRKYRYNPIFYPDYRRNRYIQNSGRGSISFRNNNNAEVSLATYVKLRFSTKNHRSYSVNSEVLIVNINILGPSPAENTKQLKIVLDRVQQLSSRGRAPVILMGDLKHDETNLQSILDLDAYRYTVLHNTLNKRFNPNAYTPVKRVISNNVYSYILEHKLNTIFAATVSDSLKTESYAPSSQKPIFAAFERP